MPEDLISFLVRLSIKSIIDLVATERVAMLEIAKIILIHLLVH